MYCHRSESVITVTIIVLFAYLLITGVTGLRLSLGTDSRSIQASWVVPNSSSLIGYRVTWQIVGIGDCDHEHRSATLSVVVDNAAATQLLIDEVMSWRQYRIVVRALYASAHVADDAVAFINTTESGHPVIQCIMLYVAPDTTFDWFSGRCVYIQQPG